MGVVIDGSMSGGSPSAQAIKTINYFDPGRVLVRPPEFMNVQVLNENGNTGVVIDAKQVEFGAFIGSREYQLGQFADFDSNNIKVFYAHTGAPTCLDAAVLVFKSAAFKGLSGPPAVLTDQFDASVNAQGKLAVSLVGDELTVSVPAMCLNKPMDEVAAVIKLL